MTEAHAGGPAFPESRRIRRAGYDTNEHEPVGGMTLRDYFAARAMPLVFEEYRSFKNGAMMNLQDYTDVAGDAFRLADAMLKARQS